MKTVSGLGRHNRRTLVYSLVLALGACAGTPSTAPARSTAVPGTTVPMPSPKPAAPPAAPDLDEAGFAVWLAAYKAEALTKGISQAVLDRAFAGVTPHPRVVELDRRQPEGRITFSKYFQNTVTSGRITKGRQLMADNAGVLASVAATYGVPAKVVVALWGVETSFGANQGGFSVIRSLATLAYEGRRAEFFRDELTKALLIMQREGFGPEKMIGSWAGAMGQSQFMPSSYLKWAVDFDGDGHRDIWATRADVFASAANYLKQNGWVAGEHWGRPVRVPPGLPRDLVTLDTRRSLAEWQALGVRLPDGGDLPSAEMSASLINPGDEGRYWLVYENFRVIMRWNRSTYFAMSVLSLADSIGP